MGTLLIVLGVVILGGIGLYLTRDPNKEDPLTMDEVKDNLDNLGQNIKAFIFCPGQNIKDDAKEIVVEVKEKLDLNDDGKVNFEDAAIAVKAVKQAAKGAKSSAKRAVQRAKKKKLKE